MRLRLLGPVDLRDTEGNVLHSVLSQTKRIALLAYVGTSPDWVRRSQLLGVFWPDLPEERARHALSQALYHLRRRLGERVVATRGDCELRLDPAHVECDVAHFRATLERGDAAEAAELYCGDFMEGFHLPDSRTFDEWLTRTRSDLRTRAAWCSLSVATTADPTSDSVTVVRMSWRASELAPYDESLQRRAARRLLDVGDRGAAARLCEDLVGRLARDLNVEPDPETVALLESLRVPAPPPAADQPTPDPSDPTGGPSPPSGVRGTDDGEPAGAPRAGGSRRSSAGVIGLAALTGGALTIATFWPFEDPQAREVVRFEIPFAPGQAPATIDALRGAGALLGGHLLALSQDGSTLVYVRVDQTGTRLWSRDLNTWDGRPVAGTDGAARGFLSPDGAALAFFTAPPSSELRRVTLDGSPAQTLADSVHVEAHGSWGSGFIYYIGHGGDLRRVPEEGGASMVLLAPGDHGVASFAHPAALPSGRGVLVTIRSRPNATGAPSDSIAVFDNANGALHPLTAGVEAAYVDPGYLIALTASGTLVATAFDPEDLRATGPTVPVLRGIPVEGRDANIAFSLGGLVVYEGFPNLVLEPVWVGRSGIIESLEVRRSAPPGRIETLDLSADGRTVLMTVRSPAGADEMWVETTGTPPRRLDAPRDARGPVWMPADTSILFLSESESGGGYDVWSRSIHGSGRAERVLDVEPSVAEVRVGAGGELIVRTALRPSADIVRVDPGASDPELHPVAATPHIELTPDLSPDGRWLAYVSTRSGRPEVYVQPYPDADRTHRVSLDGGFEPRWTRGGRELVFKDPSGTMMAVELEDGAEFRIRSRTPLFRLPPGHPLSLESLTYDVTETGDRFLMLRPVFEDFMSVGPRYRAVSNLGDHIDRRLRPGGVQ